MLKTTISAGLILIFTIGQNLPPFLPPFPDFDTFNINPTSNFVIPFIPSGPTLEIKDVTVTNMCFLDSNPLASNPIEGGSGSVMITTITYSGPAKNLSVKGLTNGSMLIECSIDLINWFAFPSRDMQLTLLPTNSSAIITDKHDTMFFRGRML